MCLWYGDHQALKNVNIEIPEKSITAFIGPSGCGKSTLGLTMLKLMKQPGRIASGRIAYSGRGGAERDILAMGERELLGVRGKNIAMIFQNPLTSLAPLARGEAPFVETIRAHEGEATRRSCVERAAAILGDLGIETSRLRVFPFQLSGGMRQRIMIGLALVLRPDLLLADEPTTALDVIVEAGFTELLMKLKRQYDLTVMMISHNLGLVAEIADRIAVMYGGRIVELASAREIFDEPLHPYTRGLMDCVPNILLDRKELRAMPGSPPDLVGEPLGCPFAPRCPEAMDICRKAMPPTADLGGRSVACWLRSRRD